MLTEGDDRAVVDESSAPKFRSQLGQGRMYCAVGVSGNLSLRLTEFPDPDGEATYFLVPNPADERLVDDELMEQQTGQSPQPR